MSCLLKQDVQGSLILPLVPVVLGHGNMGSPAHPFAGRLMFLPAACVHCLLSAPVPSTGLCPSGLWQRGRGAMAHGCPLPPLPTPGRAEVSLSPWAWGTAGPFHHPGQAGGRRGAPSGQWQAGGPRGLGGPVLASPTASAMATQVSSLPSSSGPMSTRLFLSLRLSFWPVSVCL